MHFRFIASEATLIELDSDEETNSKPVKLAIKTAMKGPPPAPPTASQAALQQQLVDMQAKYDELLSRMSQHSQEPPTPRVLFTPSAVCGESPQSCLPPAPVPKAPAPSPPAASGNPAAAAGSQDGEDGVAAAAAKEQELLERYDMSSEVG